MTPAIEAQIERSDPGFSDLVLDRTAITARGMAAYDPNYVGGDIGGGVATWYQTVLRPVPRSTTISVVRRHSPADPPLRSAERRPDLASIRASGRRGR